MHCVVAHMVDVERARARVCVMLMTAERVNGKDNVLVVLLQFGFYIKLSLSMSLSVVIDFILRFVSVYGWNELTCTQLE